MDARIADSLVTRRSPALLAGLFSAAALALSAIGTYGVVAYSVAQRTREIGLRMALGADQSIIRGMVLGSVARMTVIGGIIGLALALGAGWAVRSQLFGMSSFDPTALISSAVLLVVVALCAGIVPARRAARVDPMLALRYE